MRPRLHQAMLHELSAPRRRQRIRALRCCRGALAACLALASATSLSAASEPTAVAIQPAPTGSSVESASFEAAPIEAVRMGRLVEKLKASRGHITVLNVWATWCKPCLEEMPELVRFFREYRSKGVRFLSVSADHPDTLADRVRPYIEQQRIPFAVWVVGGESPDELVQAIDPRWQGSLPATFVFDASGARRQAWYEAIKYADLAGAVDALLEDSRPSGSITAPGDKGSVPPSGAAVAQSQSDSLPSFDAIAERAGTLEAAGLVLDLPENWAEEPPRSAMRLAQYRLPGKAGPAELAVFAFGPGQGGTPQENIERWTNQFTHSHEAGRQAESNVRSIEAGELKVWIVQTCGVYHPTPMGPSQPEREPQAGQGLFSLIIEGGPAGTVFVKVIGPQATVEAHTPALEAFARSVRQANDYREP